MTRSHGAPGSGATVSGVWAVVSDASAAGGKAVRDLDTGAAKLTEALAQPANYFEQTFTADAGVPYRLWIRGRAQNTYWGNDSVFVQFDGTMEGGAAAYRIGSSCSNSMVFNSPSPPTSTTTSARCRLASRRPAPP